MENMERLMAYGLDYYDAEFAVEVAQLDDETLSVLSHSIAVSRLMDDEDLQCFEGNMVLTNNIKIMLEALETDPISLN